LRVEGRELRVWNHLLMPCPVSILALITLLSRALRAKTKVLRPKMGTLHLEIVEESDPEGREKRKRADGIERRGDERRGEERRGEERRAAASEIGSSRMQTARPRL